MKDTILAMKHLYCGYGKLTVLHDITFSVFPGEMISIIGPNGSGKTTLLQVATNILKPDKGEVYIQGRNIKETPDRQLARKIAVVTQFVEVSGMTVKEYIMLGRPPYFKKYQFFETSNDEKLAQTYMELTEIH